MNWAFFFSIDQHTFPHMVMQFYKNMWQPHRQKDVLHAEVNGKSITVDVQSLSEILSVEATCNELREPNDEKFIGDYNMDYLMPAVYKKEVIARYLPKDARMCHYLLIHYVMPKTESVNSVSNKERCVI
ncbi:hypothetical protein M5689_012798 [Euphorbia peplus]|nr:hypothetical protein M5689_012798 [Euphorbia peplus]